jgi:hypothetical protein
VSYKAMRSSPDDSAFSIFKFCDEATMKIINSIQELAQARIYHFTKRSEE